ncbi:MAG TPA: hypothetical protein VGF33_04825, partial [Caulobacteraceae bacterium]
MADDLVANITVKIAAPDADQAGQEAGRKFAQGLEGQISQLTFSPSGHVRVLGGPGTDPIDFEALGKAFGRGAGGGAGGGEGGGGGAVAVGAAAEAASRGIAALTHAYQGLAGALAEGSLVEAAHTLTEFGKAASEAADPLTEIGGTVGKIVEAAGPFVEKVAGMAAVATALHSATYLVTREGVEAAETIHSLGEASGLGTEKMLGLRQAFGEVG